jgi:FkbM family methyltransferase
MKQLKEDFFAGGIAKTDYIPGMNAFHRSLFEYAEFIKDTDVKSIEITDGKVVMTSRSGGVKFVCDPTDQRMAPIEILNFNEYEKEDCDMIFRVIKDGFTVFDIGGNFGWYSLHIAKRRQAKIYTFEPIPKTHAYLKENIAINGIDSIELFNFGFSDREQDLNFYYYPEGSGNASSENLSGSDKVETVTCHVKKLDDFVAKCGCSIDFIKCDVEGAELLVFKGGLETIRRDRPIVFAELLRKWAVKFGYHPNEVLELFRGLGYRCFTVSGAKLVEFGVVDDQTRETNFFFLHPEKHAETIDSLLA